MKSLRRIRNRSKRCYELAAMVMMSEPGAEHFTLVHGRTGLRGGDIPSRKHAWIELNDGQIYDPVLDQYMNMADYVVLNGVVEIDDRYTQMEAALVMANTNHSGPWRDVDWVPDAQEFENVYRALWKVK
jgi:hypothetical protein